MIDANERPSGNGANGERDPRGRFAVGNAGGPGNPHSKAAATLRAALYEAVTADDVREIVRALVEQAKAGNVQAGRELLDRTLGKPEAIDLLERLEAIEAALGERLTRVRGAA